MVDGLAERCTVAVSAAAEVIQLFSFARIHQITDVSAYRHIHFVD
jgi:hypothetical protein